MSVIGPNEISSTNSATKMGGAKKRWKTHTNGSKFDPIRPQTLPYIYYYVIQLKELTG
jgi:hypothetical protein